jgi:hypothetical protein
MTGAMHASAILDRIGFRGNHGLVERDIDFNTSK